MFPCEAIILCPHISMSVYLCGRKLYVPKFFTFHAQCLFTSFLVLVYELLSLRYVNPNIKLMIGIGGPDMPDEGWTNMTAHATSRNTFVYSTVEFLKHFKLDGVDLAWFYPNSGGKHEK